MLLVAERIARGRILRSDNRRDIAGINLIDILSLVGVHLQNTAEAFSLAFLGIESGFTGGNTSGIHTEEAELADIRVCHNLKGKRGKRRIVGGRSFLLLVRLRIDSSDVRNVRRCRHIIHDGVEKLLNALISVRGSADDGNDFILDRRGSERLFQLVGGNLLTAAVFLEQFLIRLGDGFDHLLSVFLSEILHIVGNGFHSDILAEIVIIDVGLHIDQVNNTAEGILLAHRKLDRHRVCFEAFLDHFHYAVEIRARDVHLVDISHSRDLILVSLTPYGLRLRLHTALGTEHRNRSVKHAERPLHLYREIHVSGRIDDVDTVSLPKARRRGGGDGNTSFLFLLHPVHRRGAVMDLAELMGLSGIEKDPFRCRCFSRINMSHDTDITRIFKRVFSTHIFAP